MISGFNVSKRMCFDKLHANDNVVGIYCGCVCVVTIWQRLVGRNSPNERVRRGGEE